MVMESACAIVLLAANERAARLMMHLRLAIAPSTATCRGVKMSSDAFPVSHGSMHMKMISVRYASANKPIALHMLSQAHQAKKKVIHRQSVKGFI